MNDEKGSPLSRANDHVCRETVATVLIQAEVMLTIKIAVMMHVPALLCVTLKKTWIKGYPVGDWMMSKTLPRQKQKVMIMMKPIVPLIPAAHIMALGRTKEASLISSDIWTAESAPMSV